ncbi:MAG: hypothetical protein H8D46_02555 [FCB group bacterium]|nr:hypothetical protein [FCB group bacterium]
MIKIVMNFLIGQFIWIVWIDFIGLRFGVCFRDIVCPPGFLSERPTAVRNNTFELY